MERINEILNNAMFKQCIADIETCEQDRIFCRHNLIHFLDVARIAYILNLEEGYHLPKEVIYASGLLHDCGKHMQYQKGIPHNRASSEIAAAILQSCAFTEQEISRIVAAIESHRNPSIEQEHSLRGLLYRADKMSRNCLTCSAIQDCSWTAEQKNRKLLQ